MTEPFLNESFSSYARAADESVSFIVSHGVWYTPGSETSRLIHCDTDQLVLGSYSRTRSVHVTALIFHFAPWWFWKDTCRTFLAMLNAALSFNGAIRSRRSPDPEYACLQPSLAIEPAPNSNVNFHYSHWRASIIAHCHSDWQRWQTAFIKSKSQPITSLQPSFAIPPDRTLHRQLRSN